MEINEKLKLIFKDFNETNNNNLIFIFGSGISNIFFNMPTQKDLYTKIKNELDIVDCSLDHNILIDFADKESPEIVKNIFESAKIKDSNKEELKNKFIKILKQFNEIFNNKSNIWTFNWDTNLDELMNFQPINVLDNVDNVPEKEIDSSKQEKSGVIYHLHGTLEGQKIATKADYGNLKLLNRTYDFIKERIPSESKSYTWVFISGFSLDSDGHVYNALSRASKTSKNIKIIYTDFDNRSQVAKKFIENYFRSNRITYLNYFKIFGNNKFIKLLQLISQFLQLRNDNSSYNNNFLYLYYVKPVLKRIEKNIYKSIEDLYSKIKSNQNIKENFLYILFSYCFEYKKCSFDGLLSLLREKSEKLILKSLLWNYTSGNVIKMEPNFHWYINQIKSIIQENKNIGTLYSYYLTKVFVNQKGWQNDKLYQDTLFSFIKFKLNSSFEIEALKTYSCIEYLKLDNKKIEEVCKITKEKYWLVNNSIIKNLIKYNPSNQKLKKLLEKVEQHKPKISTITGDEAQQWLELHKIKPFNSLEEVFLCDWEQLEKGEENFYKLEGTSNFKKEISNPKIFLKNFNKLYDLFKKNNLQYFCGELSPLNMRNSINSWHELLDIKEKIYPENIWRHFFFARFNFPKFEEYEPNYLDEYIKKFNITKNIEWLIKLLKFRKLDYGIFKSNCWFPWFWKCLNAYKQNNNNLQIFKEYLNIYDKPEQKYLLNSEIKETTINKLIKNLDPKSLSSFNIAIIFINYEFIYENKSDNTDWSTVLNCFYNVLLHFENLKLDENSKIELINSITRFIWLFKGSHADVIEKILIKSFNWNLNKYFITQNIVNFFLKQKQFTKQLIQRIEFKEFIWCLDQFPLKDYNTNKTFLLELTKSVLLNKKQKAFWHYNKIEKIPFLLNHMVFPFIEKHNDKRISKLIMDYLNEIFINSIQEMHFGIYNKEIKDGLANINGKLNTNYNWVNSRH